MDDTTATQILIVCKICYTNCRSLKTGQFILCYSLGIDKTSQLSLIPQKPTGNAEIFILIFVYTSQSPE